jgi:osmotically-inducible protein OsmY
MPQSDQTSPSSSSTSKSTPDQSANPSSSTSSTSSQSGAASSTSGMPQSDTGGSDLQSKIQAALQQQNLSGVSVNATDSAVELTGTVNSAKEHKQALRIAKENAKGKNVVDHIQVGSGSASH